MPTQTISRCGQAAAGAYPATVLAIGGAGNLRGYWRLGETSGLFADTSGFNVADPCDLIVDGNGANARGVTGAIGPANDDGAWQLEVKGNPGGLGFVRATPHAGENIYTGTGSAFTVGAWIRVSADQAGDTPWTGSILNNAGIIAGSPSFERGWRFGIVYHGDGSNPSLQLARANDAGDGGIVSATLAGIVPGTDYFAHGTFDGATIEVGVNGTTFATQADTLRSIPDNNGLTVGLGVLGQYFGVVDELAFWGAVLTHADLLYLATVGSA